MRQYGRQGKRIFLWGMIMLIFLMCFSLVSAVPPVTQVQQFVDGYIILGSPTEVIQQNQNYQYNFFAYNISNGKQIQSDTADCTFYMANNRGTVLFSTIVPKIDGYWALTINGANFSEAGHYPYGIICNSTTLGGAYVNYFTVTPSGIEFTIGETYLYIIGLIFLVLLIFGTVYIIGTLPSKDSMDEEGSILHVSQLKHLREVLWVFVWGISLAIMFVLSNIFLAYLSTALMGNLFFVLYRIMFYVTIIGVPIYFVWIIYKVFKSSEMKKMIERGVDFKGI